MAEAVERAAVAKPQKRKSKGGILAFLTKFMPTNYNMVRMFGLYDERQDGELHVLHVLK